jgi:hypothetical protein
MSEALFGRSVGAGSPFVVAPCESFTVSLAKRGNNYPPTPSALDFSIFSGVSDGTAPNGVDGYYWQSGYNKSTAPVQMPAGYGEFDIVTYTSNGLLASCQAASCPKGQYWNGTVCVPIPPPIVILPSAKVRAAQMYQQAMTFPAGSASRSRLLVEAGQIAGCPVGQTWNGRACVSIASQGGGAVGGVATSGAQIARIMLLGGGAGGVGGSAPMTLVQGRRYATSTTSPSGALPPGLLGLTTAQVQAQLAAAGNPNKCVSVKYAGNTLIMEVDHCGPSTQTDNPFVITDSGVTLSTAYTDMNTTAQCAAVAAPGWSTTKKVLVVGGVSAAVLAAAYAAWRFV